MREAKEELNLEDFIPDFILKHIIETERERELTYCYYTVTDQKPRPDMDEVSDGRFWTIDEISKSLGTGIFTPNFEIDFTTFLSSGLKPLIS